MNRGRLRCVGLSYQNAGLVTSSEAMSEYQGQKERR
jgi:hypothetical protein